jgi:putative permease
VLKVFKEWVERYLSDPEAIILLVILIGGFLILKAFGSMLTPIFLSIAIAMLLQFWVNLLVKHKCPPALAMWLVYLMFVIVFFGAIFFLLPLLWHQFENLFAELPVLAQNGHKVITDFFNTNHTYISSEYLDSLFNSLVDQSQDWGKHAISVSLASIPGVITCVVYAVLVPMLVFFFMRDHVKILNWFKRFLPKKRGLIRKIWYEMHVQIGNYVRGKLAEIVIVGIVTYAVFLFFDLRYQVLLACLVGLSVVIPYVGIVLATIPVLLVGYFQWGFTGGLSGEFALMIYSYTFVQLVDGGILVPLLFSEAVNLHPLAIIIAILFFGSIWGFWGVFFAIPLATLVKSLINAWPQHHHARAHH